MSSSVTPPPQFAATRGRDSNRLYVDTRWDPDPQTSHDGTSEAQTAREVLVGVLRNEGADRSAHKTIRRSMAEADSMARLAAEYQTIAKAAQADRWNGLLERSGLTADQVAQVQASDAYGPLVAAFRHAEAAGLDIDTALPALVAGRTLVGVDDVASVLHGRVDRWVETAGTRRHARGDDLVVGLIPRARHVSDPDMRRGLVEREQAMEQRAITLVEQAVESGEPWLRRLGTPPAEPARRIGWLRDVCTVAAYRDRWNITGPTVIGRRADASSVEQLGQHKRAEAAIDHAVALTRTHDQTHSPDSPRRDVRIENGVQL
jgi:hypothetical protein